MRKVIIKTEKLVLDKDDLEDIKLKLRKKGSTINKFLTSHKLSCSYLNSIIIQENDASYIVGLLKKEGIRLKKRKAICEN